MKTVRNQNENRNLLYITCNLIKKTTLINNETNKWNRFIAKLQRTTVYLVIALKIVDRLKINNHCRRKRIIHMQLKFKIFKNNSTQKVQNPGIAYPVAIFVWMSTVIKTRKEGFLTRGGKIVPYFDGSVKYEYNRKHNS